MTDSSYAVRFLFIGGITTDAPLETISRETRPRTRSDQVRKSNNHILFIAALAALTSCTPLAELRETNRGESVFGALTEINEIVT
jgi:hypothetical protein